MPIEPLPVDEFTRNALLIGLPVVDFQSQNSDGTFNPLVELGILESAELVKDLDTLKLQNSASGFQTVNREIVSRLEPSLDVSTFNLQPNVAELVWGSTDGVIIVANAAEPQTDLIQIPSGTDSSRTFEPLSKADINLTPLVLTAALITDEAIGTGDGALGPGSGDFALAFKVNDFTDVVSVIETDPSGAVVQVYTPIDGAGVPTSSQVAIVDTIIATSGNLEFLSAIAIGNTLTATYTPLFTLESDFQNVTPDMLIDRLLGRINFPNTDSPTSKDGASALRQGQIASLAYQYNRRASTEFKPFTRPSVSGKATVRQLSSIGVNFRWDIPSVSLVLTDDNITFGVEDFATGALSIGINDAGGTDRFGTMRWSTEPEANA